MTIALGLIALMTGVIVLVLQVRGGRFFSILTFATGLFLLESVGAAVKATFTGVFPDFALTDWHNPIAFVPRALVIYLVSYFLMLSGYVLVTLYSRGRNVDRRRLGAAFFSRVWTRRYRFVLMLLTLTTVAIGFAQHYTRIRAAGGFSEFLSTAYLYRFGSGTATAGESALVGISNLVAAGAVSFIALWVMAWAHGHLSTGMKLFVLAMIALLLFRQATSMLRASLFFSIVAICAAVESEIRLPLRRLLTIGLLLLAVLVLMNFAHYTLYSLTGGWDKSSFMDIQAQILSPHAHISTLAHILEMDSSGKRHLHGSGILESVFFFVPRLVWETKLPSDQYGTMAVQSWAGLATHYQIAVTPVGELIAHGGTATVLLMIPYGIWFGLLDSFRNATPDLRAALFGILLPRVLGDFGMGISAIAITTFSLLLFLAEVHSAEFLSRLFRPTSREVRVRQVRTIGVRV